MHQKVQWDRSVPEAGSYCVGHALFFMKILIKVWNTDFTEDISRKDR